LRFTALRVILLVRAPKKGARAMAIEAEQVTTLEPRLIERRNGGWLAVTEDDSPVRVGVVGDTETEARERFREALARWRTAYERLNGVADVER
jgi:hypothetical protein